MQGLLLIKGHISEREEEEERERQMPNHVARTKVFLVCNIYVRMVVIIFFSERHLGPVGLASQGFGTYNRGEGGT